MPMDWPTLDAERLVLEQRMRMKLGAQLVELARVSLDANLVIRQVKGRRIVEVRVDKQGQPVALLVALS